MLLSACSREEEPCPLHCLGKSDQKKRPSSAGVREEGLGNMRTAGRIPSGCQRQIICAGRQVSDRHRACGRHRVSDHHWACGRHQVSVQDRAVRQVWARHRVSDRQVSDHQVWGRRALDQDRAVHRVSAEADDGRAAEAAEADDGRNRVHCSTATARSRQAAHCRPGRTGP